MQQIFCNCCSNEIRERQSSTKVPPVCLRLPTCKDLLAMLRPCTLIYMTYQVSQNVVRIGVVLQSSQLNNCQLHKSSLVNFDNGHFQSLTPQNYVAGLCCLQHTDWHVTVQPQSGRFLPVKRWLKSNK